jgi:hypothetical protein
MKRFLLALMGVLAASSGIEAQSNDQMVQRALAPLSGRAAEGATVVRWNDDHSHTTLKEGSNGYVCYDRSSDPGRPAFAVQCTNLGNLERVAQNRRFAAEAMGDREVNGRLVAEAEANGTRVPAVFGSVWISMNGNDQASAGRHVTVAVPGATAESLGFPDNGRSGGVWIMAGGTSEAHLMVP